jgi:hypothetical protein
MRTFRQLGAVLLLLVTCVAPAMACMVPNTQMTAQERACCRTMKNDCGQMEMPSSHSCCRKASASADEIALNSQIVVLPPVFVEIVWQAAAELRNPTMTVTGWIDRPGYSPPASPPSTISILRI